jgi:signal transduction histidine kinase
VERIDFAKAELRPDGAPPQQRLLALPFRWDRTFPGAGGSAQLLLQLPRPAPPHGRQALLFEQVGNQVTVRVNGTIVGQVGSATDSAPDAGHSSHVFVVPEALLDADGSDELALELYVQPLRQGGLAAVRYGPLDEIEALAAPLQLWGPSAAAAYAASLLLAGGLAAGLWWRQRDPLYGTFAIAAFSGALRHVDRVLPAAPLPWPWWGALLAVTYAVHLALIARFVVLLLERPPPRLLQAIHVTMAVAVVLAAASFAWREPRLWTAAPFLLLALGVACFGAVVREAVLGRRPVAWVVLGIGSALLAAGVHDVLRVRLGWFGGSSFRLAPHVMFFFVMMLAARVIARYSRTVADYRTLNVSLAARIAEREGQLRQAFDTLREQQQQQAVLGERQRIMREIHDGIGSQLVGLLGMVGQRDVDRGALEEQVKLALDEMRMAVDSLQPVHDDLTTVLATLRYRLQPRLQAARIAIVWDVGDLPPMPWLAPQVILQLQRILLEAFTNVLKHARATQVTVAARWQAGGAHPSVLLQLSDDGIGVQAPPDGAPPGHGIANMRSRAAAIGAMLRVETPAEGGTRVSIVLPGGAATMSP